MMKTDKVDNNLDFIAFKTMVKRDLVVQARNKWEFVFRVAMLPFVLILLYGYILPRVGIVEPNFPNQMFPGMVGRVYLLQEFMVRQFI